MLWLAENYGNCASVLGLMVSVVTLIVAARTQGKIEKAREQLLAKVDTVEASWSAGGVEIALAELHVFCEGRDWAFAIDRCKTVIRMLHGLKKCTTLVAIYLIRIRTAIEDMQGVQQSIEVKHQRRDKRDLDKRKKALISALSLAIADIRDTINRAIREA